MILAWFDAGQLYLLSMNMEIHILIIIIHNIDCSISW